MAVLCDVLCLFPSLGIFILSLSLSLSLWFCCCHAQVSHVVIIIHLVINMRIAAFGGIIVMYSCVHLFWYVVPVIASILFTFPTSAIGRKQAAIV